MKSKQWLSFLLVVLLSFTGWAMAQREFIYLEGQEIPTIDPAMHVDESSLHAVINMYDPLVYPRVQEGLMEPGPHVAESWEVSPDGLTYTFQIRRGIPFHDGGELTAEDVVFSIQRMLAIQRGFSWLWLDILEPQNVQAVDTHTVEFVLNEPFAPFLSTLTQLFIVNRNLLMEHVEEGEFGEYGDYGQAFLIDNTAGSGPFQLVNYERASILEMERFPDYWRGWEDGQVEKVIYRVVKEEATHRTLLQAGQAHMTDQWRTPTTYRLLQQAPGIVVDETPSAQLFHVQMNTQRAPLDNIHVRRAIAHAFDYDAALEQIFIGAVQARGPVPIVGWEAYGRTPQVEPYRQDLELAREALAESGYEPEQIRLNYVYPEGGDVQRQVGLLLQSNLAEIGIQINLQETPWARIVEMSAEAETTPDLAAIYDTLKYPHPDSHLYGMYHPSAIGSYRTISRFDQPEVTELLERARRATDTEEQLDLYMEAERLIVEAYPSLFIANPMHRIAFREEVQGYRYVGLLGYDVAFYDFRLAE
ncbi:MAG: ABC transporter substrate-binding protein [Thermosphaera sp.]